ncbi:ImmA/IrrE family metallo-endopeptidase [Sporolactobacillus sp. CQH2019]|uniref:ImmA/IrrE family metallo-endopeptidase n=1 Tax=Sporolactobacillus sp. CQH2019 TaxID=3023512 RepID=UPI00236892A0|nr:ImmA/IrrE family metallo-endopeptidase [Sporolactobacillus sp. CQH2019]MDD9149226.1 ImmA/IrrE family metallo-endopeptidase [Sporolactobacillus sp. CQH2019]
MNIPTTPRYDFATNTAYEFLIDNKLIWVPNIIKIMRSKGFIVISYTELCNQIGWDSINLRRLRHSASAITRITNKGNYQVWYNELTKKELPKSIGELRFDLAHELGHIELGHLRDFNLSSVNLSGEIVLEREADCFARNLLEPVHLISMLRLKLMDKSDKHIELVQSLFKVTEPAAKVRCVGWLQQSDYRYTSRENRKSIVQLLTPRMHWFTWYKKCRNCGHETLDPNIRYCTICGESDFDTYSIKNFIRLQKERGKNKMIYPGHDIDENGKATVCPRCGNEEIVDGEFCKICGTHIVNRCTNIEGNNYDEPCGITVDGNARYCPKCGSETTFFQDKLLKPWSAIRKENNTEEDSDNQNEVAATSQPTFEDPFAENDKPIDISDDDLPF